MKGTSSNFGFGVARVHGSKITTSPESPRNSIVDLAIQPVIKITSYLFVQKKTPLRGGEHDVVSSLRFERLSISATVEIDQDLSRKCVGPLALARLYGESR